MEAKTVTATVIKGVEGKSLRHLSNNWIADTEIYLGYTYYLGSRKLVEPILEPPEHYEEIDTPEECVQ